MKKTPLLLLCIFLFSCSQMYAQNVPSQDTVYVHLRNGALDVFPGEVLKSQETTTTHMRLVLQNDSVITYALSEVDHLGGAPLPFPKFTSFKFNNKYNENVYRDVYGKIGDNEISATVGAIGKSLTPSFQLNVPNALVFVGNVQQESKVSRHRFDHPITYVVTNAENARSRVLARVKTKDAIWSDPVPAGPVYRDITLRTDMLSTNAESNYPDREGLDKLLDGNRSTFFHSTWGYGVHEKLPLDQHPYVEVALDEALDHFLFKYVTRGDADNRNPLSFLVSGSNDRKQWTDIVTLTEKDGMPGWGRGMEYVSPNITCGAAYRYLRFTLVDCAYKNYLALAEFSLHQYLGESGGEPPHMIEPEQYNYLWQPFGRTYQVKVDWRTDADTAQVPSIHIQLKDNKFIENIDKQTYLRADIVFDGGHVFPDLTDTVLIKGRGNTSWGQSAKKPYRLKFAASVKPFGLTKGKNWVLLANNQSGSMLTNAIGMKIARMVKTAGANDIIPVDLYINGEYRGSYNFTQHVGLHNNSVDIDETNAALLELDSYYDEDYKFRDASYDLPVNIKEPDLKDILDPVMRETLEERVKQDFMDFTAAVSGNREVEKWLDPMMAARYLMVNELAHNTELKHPKSCFLFREDLLAMHSRYILGPVWDLDWGFGYETEWPNYAYCSSDPCFDYFRKGLRSGRGASFFNDVRQLAPVKRAYYAVWKDFMDHHFQELQEYIGDYFAFAEPSFVRNGDIWGDGRQYAQVALQFKDWLTTRATYIYENLERYDLNTPVAIERGDVNRDGAISMGDVVSLQTLLQTPSPAYDTQADANSDGRVSVTDLVWIVAWAMQAEPDAVRHMALPAAEATLRTQTFTATLNRTSVVPVDLNIAQGNYVATQFDLLLPEGMVLEDIVLPEAWAECKVESHELGEGRFRVAAYMVDGTTLPTGKSTLQLMVKANRTIERAARVVSLEMGALVTAQGEDERLSGKSALFDMDVTSVDDVVGREAVRGGAYLHIETLVPGEVKVYTMDGRLVKVCPVVPGENRIPLLPGVYLVNQTKVIINK